jgi:hypothetical protein
MDAKVIQTNEHHEWEHFSRQRLFEGGELRRYYPLSEDARPEFEAWLSAQQLLLKS